MKAYNLLLGSGRFVRLEAQSAGDAIEKALWAFRGLTVVRCYQGFDGQDSQYPQGGIEFEVPAHPAISATEIQKKQNLKREDKTDLMPFMDSEEP